MTLIIPVGKESLSCVSEDGDDADSGCLAGSPEDTLKKHFAKTCFLNKLEDISSISADEGEIENIECIKCPESQDQCSYDYSSEESRFTKPSVIDSEVVRISTGPKSTSGSKIIITENSDSNIEILNNSNTDTCPESSCYEKTENFRNERFSETQASESKLSSSPISNLNQEHHSSEIKSERDCKNVKIIESRTSPERNLKLINLSNGSGTISFNLHSKENQTVRLRKLLQRRSVSESSSNDLEIKKQKKVRENIRHSFSSYESCDKLRNILTSDFYTSSKGNLGTEYFKNATNDLLSSDRNLESLRNSVNNNNSNKITYESRSRISNFEIPDTLINNVKKSMIAEYQKLKKNSSLAYHPPTDSFYKVDSDSHMSDNIPVENKRFSCTNDNKIDCNELVSQDLSEQVERNSISISDTGTNNGNNLINSNYSNTFQVSEVNDITHSTSYPFNSNVKAASDRESSPPIRLELWKSILAEKKNSIKKQIVQKVDRIERGERSHSGISIDCKNDFNDNEISTNNHKIHPSDEDLQVPLSDKSLTTRYILDHENSREPTETATLLDDFKNDGLQTCFNDLEITTSNDSLADEDESKIKRKSKLAEACQGIVYALDSLPDPESEKENLHLQQKSEFPYNDTENSSGISDRDSTLINNDMKSKNINFAASSIASIITTIQPPKCSENFNNEKGQQCPTPLYCSDDETFYKGHNVKGNPSISSGNESDYCQTDNCGDDCDYCSGDEAEDELDDTCDACRRSSIVSSVCKHMRVMTNGSLKSFKNQSTFNDFRHNKMISRSLNLQSVLRRSHINHQELSAIREYSVTSDEHQDSDDELSHDGSICDISSSWRYGLCEDQRRSYNEVKHKKNKEFLASNSKQFAKLKSNSLPASKTYSRTTPPKRPESAVLKQNFYSDDDSPAFNASSGGVHLPPRPPRLKRNQHPILSVSPPSNSTSITPPQTVSPRPTMGLQGLQQKPSYNKHSLCIQTGPKTLAPRSPLNPNPPYGFPSPPSPPIGSPGSPFQGRKSPLEAPPSPRTNSRSGALVTRNFSISDDEGGQRLSRRQVTITRHESAYKEAAEKGYLLPPSSPIDPYWLTWKLGVLLKTAEEVGSRLEESEKVVSTWGPLPQDQNLADQYVHNIRKFRETLPDLQRGVDDVNDQAARFSSHNVPLTPANSAALHDINSRWKNLETTVNDRWRQVAGRSREVTPLTPAQLASSVSPPWERATATNKVPYYINHAQETTHWDHPQMMDLLDSLSEFNHIKFSAYRTATKLRSLQKKLSLDRAKLQMVTDVFDEHGLRGQNDRLIDVNDMIVVLSTLYGRISSDYNDVNTTLATDLCLNWLLNVYDSQRTGQMRVLSFRVGLICLCRGHLEEKYRYMFRLIADPNRLVDQRKLGLLLHDCVQVPRQLGEVAAFGGSNIEPSVRSCFTKAGKDRETIEAVHFLTWVQQEPQSLVWLAVLHRVAASESVQHQVKCNICKTYPIVGLRYRCLKCLSFDMCQRCFFEGRSSKSHKITHPMHEYCTATTAGDEMKDFTKALKNKFKSKRSLQKHTKKGYLPVQTVLEGDPLESPSPSPSHNVSSQDMHSRLELYASRLAEVELRTNSNSTPDSEDEHGLIAQYCQSLSSTDAPFPVPKSPLQIMASVDADQKDELEQMIKDLEEENRALQAEYERLKSEQPMGSVSEDGMGQRSEAEMLAEAKLLREHKERLEARMSILEDHNRQLEAQLQRLRQLLVEQQTGMGSPNKSSTLQTKSVTASQLAMDSPGKINGHATQGGSGSAYEGLDQMSEYVRPPPPPVGSIAHMGNLYARAGDPEKPVGSPVASMSRETENGSHSDDVEDQSDENDYDNTVSPIPSKSE